MAPIGATKCNGVKPFSSLTFTLEPSAIKLFTFPKSPALADSCRGSADAKSFFCHFSRIDIIFEMFTCLL